MKNILAPPTMYDEIRLWRDGRRRLRHITILNTEHNQLVIKVSADN